MSPCDLPCLHTPSQHLHLHTSVLSKNKIRPVPSYDAESSLFVQMVQIPPQEMKKPELRNTSDRGRVVARSLGEQRAGYCCKEEPLR